MDILSRLFGKKTIKTEPVKETTIQEKIAVSPECERLYEIKAKIENLLVRSHYVARSEYLDLRPEYENTIEYFNVLKKSEMLDVFCVRNNISQQDVLQTIAQFTDLSNLVDSANEEYIQSQMVTDKEYLDDILKEVDPVISLDDDQRRVILSDEDYCLVIAGAGAGKTTTVAAKVKYLVERKNIDPRDILVISFTNKAVGELRERFFMEVHQNFEQHLIMIFQKKRSLAIKT